MEKLTFKSGFIRVLIVIGLIMISLFPPIMRILNSGERIGTAILGILALCGSFVLRWFLFFIFIFVLHAISNGLFKAFFHGVSKTDASSRDEVDTMAGTALVASFIIVTVLQFCASWEVGIPMISNLATFFFPQY